jgi:hypothetical protein
LEEEEDLQMKALASPGMASPGTIQRQELEEEEDLQMKAALASEGMATQGTIQRQDLEEEEDLQMKALASQGMATPGTIQRQDLEEEEDLQMKGMATPGMVQRQDLEEEEDLQMKALASQGMATPGTIQRQELEEEEDLQMKALASQGMASPGTIQRQELEEEEDLQMKSLASPGIIQRESDGGLVASGDIEERLSSLKDSGSPLPDETRADMETRFGTSFDEVRVHAGGEAVQLSRDLSAKAFTHGQDIYFGEGSYDPDSSEGQRLLAHELTHVVQQSGGQTASEQDQETSATSQPQRVQRSAVIQRAYLRPEDTQALDLIAFSPEQLGKEPSEEILTQFGEERKEEAKKYYNMQMKEQVRRLARESPLGEQANEDWDQFYQAMWESFMTQRTQSEEETVAETTEALKTGSYTEGEELPSKWRPFKRRARKQALKLETKQRRERASTELRQARRRRRRRQESTPWERAQKAKKQAEAKKSKSMMGLLGTTGLMPKKGEEGFDETELKKSIKTLQTMLEQLENALKAKD